MFKQNPLIILGLIGCVFIVMRIFLKPRQNYSTYSKRRHEQFLRAIEAMRKESSMFAPSEAMAPVESGTRELLELHGLQDTFTLEPKAGSLSIVSEMRTISISWLPSKAVTQNNRLSRRDKGCWEVRLDNGYAELYTELALVMSKISSALREIKKS
jgi:hypothetical protein